MLISKNLLLNRVIFNTSTDLPFNGYFISDVWLKVANTLVESPLLDDSLHLIEVMCKRNIYPTNNVLEKVIQKVFIHSFIHSLTHSLLISLTYQRLHLWKIVLSY